ncbi:MAG: arsenate reductase ArsC [Tissierellia bacterium]|nr:arsenate reductase ArsC [Tissierellia bacterium]
MKKVAFICVHNSCRSQIAQALGRHLAGEVFESYSAGSQVKDQINPDALRLMKDLYGIDMAKDQYPKTVAQIPDPDLAISMGCYGTCPLSSRGFDEDWQLEDPTGKDDQAFKGVIQEIEDRILDLKARLQGDLDK